MPDASDPSDPSNYATPNELAQQRLYAQALLQQGMGPIPGPAVSPFQGLAGVLGTYNATRLLNRAAQQERFNNMAGAREQPTTGGGDPSGPLSMPPPSGSSGYADDSDKYGAAISKQEGTGSYNQKGNPTVWGDRAYGKYQVMGKNIPTWTQEVLGKSLSPQEFLNSPPAQEAVFKTKFGQLAQKYGPEAAARAWYAGEDHMNNLLATDVNGKTTVGDYGKNFMKALAFNGEPAGPAAPGAAPAPTGGVPPDALALRAGGGPGGVPVPSTAPSLTAGTNPQTGQPIGALPLRTQVTDKQLHAILSNPAAPDWMKQNISELYQSQNQPVAAQGMGGTWVASPGQPPHFVPQLLTSQQKGPGGSEQTIYQYPDERGQLHQLQQGPTGAPAQTPVAPADVPSVLKYNEEPPAQGPLSALPPQNAAQAIEAALTKQGAPQPATNAPTGALPMAAPDTGAAPNAPTGGPLAAMPPGVKTAQALDPSYSQYLDETNQKAIDLARGKEFAKQDVESYTKKYNAMQDAGIRAETSMPQLKMARQLVDDPRMIQGMFAGPRLDLAKLQAWAGGDPNKAAVAELFTKIMSGNQIQDMKILLQGLGQVRVAEINLLSKATGNIYNTQPANRAVLDIMLKTHQQAQDISKAVDFYQQGYRYDAKGNVVKSNDQPSNAGLNQFTKAWLDKHPLFTQAQIDNYSKLFDGEKKAGNTQALNNGMDESSVRDAYDKAVEDAGNGNYYSQPQPAQQGAAPAAKPVPPPPRPGYTRVQ